MPWKENLKIKFSGHEVIMERLRNTIFEMWVYIFELVLIVLLGLILKSSINVTFFKKYKGNELYLAVVFLMLGTVMGLRASSVGTDSPTYYHIYQKIAASSNFNEAIQVSTLVGAPIYVLYTYILLKMSDCIQIIIILNSVIISVGFYIFIKKTSQNYMFSCFLFVALTMYYEAMNGNRQFVALALLLNSFLLLKDNIRSIKGWGLFIVSTLIHSTSLFIIIGLFGAKLVRNCRSIDIVLLRSVLMTILVCVGFELSVFGAVYFFPYLEQYVNGLNGAQIFDNSGGGRIVLLYLVLLVIVMYVTYVIKISKVCIKTLDVSFYPSIVFCVISGIVFSRNILFNRLLWVYICMLIPFIPNMFVLIRSKRSRVIVSLLTVVILLAYCTMHLIEDKSRIIPYELFWSV